MRTKVIVFHVSALCLFPFRLTVTDGNILIKMTKEKLSMPNATAYRYISHFSRKFHPEFTYFVLLFTTMSSYVS